ncbi:MAG: radical SAM protein [Dictyoglomi bacterium]|nr:radical SAM protein [Dictyoglomota bacterium]
MTVGVFYFGCKVNQYDLARITTALANANINVSVGEIGDINIIAGCVVTHKAEREGLRLIRKIKRENPNAKIFLMGCLAVHKGRELLEEGLIDDMFFTRDDEVIRLKDTLSTLLDVSLSLPHKVNLMEHSRAFLKVQDGCTYQCAFCLSRDTRISVVSYNLEEKVEELRKIMLDGVAEVVVTGINLMLWTDGVHDISYLLLKLADEAYRFGGRIRISSVYPDKKIFSLTPLWSHPGVANHMHISVQSGSGKVLNDMNRMNYIPILDEYLSTVREIDPGFGLSGDFIVGFPTETEEDFHKTVEFVRRHMFNKLHVFPYSPRVGTPAYHLNPLPSYVLKDRGRILRDVGESLKHAFIEKIKGTKRPAVFLHGKHPRVLFDNYVYMQYAEPFYGIKEISIDATNIL